MTAGDLWFNTASNNKPYRYSGTAWVATEDTRIAANAAAITSEQTARADADTALGSRIDTVVATANSKNKTFLQTAAPTTGMVAGDLWFDTDDSNKPYRYSGTAWTAITDPRIASNTAAITSEATARANADSALSSRIDTVVATASGNAAAIQTEQTARANADSALSGRVDTVQSATAAAQNTANAAQQSAEAAAIAAGNKGEVIFGSTTPTAAKRLSQNLWIDTTGGLNTPKRWNGSTWVAVTDKAATDAAAAASAAQATATEALGKANTATQNIATVQTQVNTLTTQQSATATQVSTLQTTVGNNTASIQTVSESVNGLYAQKYIKLDVDGKVAGWGGANTGKESNFIVNFDAFAIGSGNSVAYYPFIFRTTAYTDPNTGTVFPVGAYMKSAFIDYASIDTAHIKQLAVKSAQIDNAAVTTAKIDDAAITTAKIDNLAVTTGKIDNLAVTTAKIGDLQVDTLKIKDDAVSIGVGAQGVHTLSTVSNGGKIRLDIGVHGVNSSYSSIGVLYLRVLRNGTVIRVMQFYGVLVTSGYEFRLTTALPPIIETIPADTSVTYSIQVGFSNNSYVTPDNVQAWLKTSGISMAITELKK